MSISFLNSKSTNGKLTFDIKSDPKNPLDKSIVNGLRRTILNDIQTVGVEQKNIFIEDNETSLHNEFMKHRISLIPLNIDPNSYNMNLMISLDVSNKTDTIKIVTTDDFKFHPLKEENIDKEDLSLSKENYDLNSEIPENIKKKILKPYEIEGIISYIIITELKNMNSEIDFQSLKLYMFPSIGSGKINALFNNIPQCAYSFKENPALLKKANEEDMKLKGISSKKEQEIFKKEFNNSYKQRYYHRNYENEAYWYNFVIKSNHFYKSKEIFIVGLKVLVDKLNRCNENFKLISIDPEKSRYSVSMDKNKIITFILDDENDTIGNILQSHIVNNISDESLITFCGYKKIHPLEEKIKFIISNKAVDDVDELSIISKVIFSISDNIDEIINIIEELIDKSSSI